VNNEMVTEPNSIRFSATEHCITT